MTFDFEGRMFDTNHRVYVLGYIIASSWFPVKNEDIHYTNQYKTCTKRFRISALRFRDMQDSETGKSINMVSRIEVDNFHANPYISDIALNGEYIFGRSVKECKKILEERCAILKV